jgi:CRISPR-associated protein Csd2
MTVRAPVYVFKHVGTDSDEKQRQSQAMLGCAPAQLLFEKVVKVKKKERNENGNAIDSPRSFDHYEVSISLDAVPSGVELLQLPGDMKKL